VIYSGLTPRRLQAMSQLQPQIMPRLLARLPLTPVLR